MTLIDTSRRGFIKSSGLFSGALIAVGIVGSTPAMAYMPARPRTDKKSLMLHNLHTGEHYNGVFKIGDTYDRDELQKLNYFLRDHRNGKVHRIDPQTLEILARIRQSTGRVDDEMQVVSGYRSPETNALLRKASNGVAKRSMHLEGRAIDFRFNGTSTRELRSIAISMKAGGVGYYRGSNFLHIDNGLVRHW